MKQSAKLLFAVWLSKNKGHTVVELSGSRLVTCNPSVKSATGPTSLTFSELSGVSPFIEKNLTETIIKGAKVSCYRRLSFESENQFR